ncbi:uncharacterized protein VP01_6917g2 [Puccinia sorghi]|uniref:Uncharacterized protein n=1 Tax=Puccinia sorghi TaxID=27349 RepID=A0A0L6UGB1_9BASI|nr:uncharacterized protein VP01_6917g2 [Puccinia sorghi]
MSACSSNKLYSAVSEELHPVLIMNNSNIYNAMDPSALWKEKPTQ